MLLIEDPKIRTQTTELLQNSRIVPSIDIMFGSGIHAMALYPSRMYGVTPKKVLEIGCSNGFRLDYIKNKFNGECECFGLEPSEDAIKDAEKIKDFILKKVNIIKSIQNSNKLDKD